MLRMITNYKIILNPTAGKGYAVKKIPQIREHFEKNNINYNLTLSESPDHAIALSREAAVEKDTAVIAAGGDGTCNEVINGLMQAIEKDSTLKPVMGVIPIGRGNDFICGAGIPPSIEESLSIIHENNTSPLDVGLIKGGDYPEGLYFGNGIGAGLDTIIGFEANKMKHVHGGGAYILAALKTIIRYPESPVLEVTVDGKTTEFQPIILSIMNGTRMGGSFYMTPDALTNDGVFNLCMTSRVKQYRLLSVMKCFLDGSHYNLKETATMKGTEFKLKALSGSIPGHADGEKICEHGKELSISCIPAPIELLKRPAKIKGAE